MSDTGHSALRGALEEMAGQLQPISRSPFVPIIKFARDLGVEVELCVYSSNTKRDAQSYVDLNKPRIILYRRGSTEGLVQLGAESEHLLKPRERFSIAHELGHILAYKHLGTVPVSEKSDRSEYWKQEACINSFAEALLVPGWAAEQCLQKSPKHRPASIDNLKTWAYEQCRVSVEVAAKALSKVGSYIGFIKIEEGTRIVSNKRLFAVRYSASGRDLFLPNLHSFIEDPMFTDRIAGLRGRDRVEAFQLDATKCENLSIEWQEASGSATNDLRRPQTPAIRFSGKVYWVSVRKDEPTKVNWTNNLIQLNLFSDSDPPP